MKIGTPKELAAGEARVAMTPASAKELQKLGYDCLIESGAGAAAGFDDAAYKDAGVTRLSINPIGPNRLELIEKVKGWIS